jgi:hypothetical protein
MTLIGTWLIAATVTGGDPGAADPSPWAAPPGGPRRNLNRTWPGSEATEQPTGAAAARLEARGTTSRRPAVVGLYTGAVDHGGRSLTRAGLSPAPRVAGAGTPAAWALGYSHSQGAGTALKAAA